MLVLASESPRREELLRLLGIPFRVEPARIDEARRDAEPASALVVRLASAKAERVAARQPVDAVVIGADTVVVVDDEVLGKPIDDGDARHMLSRLSGRSHRVVTGMAVVAAGRIVTAIEETTVTFCVLSEDDLDWYLARGDHLGKAGAYGIQGVAGVFVTRLEGSFTNVVGLPLSTLRPLLAAAGFSL